MTTTPPLDQPSPYRPAVRRLRLAAAWVSLVAVILAVCAPWLWWLSGSARPLRTLIVDFTVPEPNYREHKALVWILNHERLVDPRLARPFRASTDYAGFVPTGGDQYTIRPIPPPAPLDLVYIADTYGVYSADFLGANDRGERSRLIFGGLQPADMDSLTPLAEQPGTFIAEFNSLADPTPASVRARLGAVLGVHWTGWTGRRFSSLDRDDEVPTWLVRNWEQQEQMEWRFSGAGFVLVHSDGRVILLRVGVDLGSNALTVVFAEDAAVRFGVRRVTPYQYWFDVVTPDSGVVRVADYAFALTDSGRQRLARHGVPERFPAVLSRTVGLSHRYYFAGDFADYPNVPWRFRLRGQLWWHRLLTKFSTQTDASFFWNVYVPMMHRILSDQAARSAESSRPPAP